MPKLKVLPRGPIRETVNGKLKTMFPGSVFDTSEERAKKLLAIVPALVERTSEKDKVVTKKEARKAAIEKAKQEAKDAKGEK